MSHRTKAAPSSEPKLLARLDDISGTIIPTLDEELGRVRLERDEIALQLIDVHGYSVRQAAGLAKVSHGWLSRLRSG